MVPTSLVWAHPYTSLLFLKNKNKSVFGSRLERFPGCVNFDYTLVQNFSPGNFSSVG